MAHILHVVTVNVLHVTCTRLRLGYLEVRGGDSSRRRDRKKISKCTFHCDDDDERRRLNDTVCLLVGWLSSQQQARVSQGRICTDNFTCCHTEIEAADQTFHLTKSQYTDTGPTSPSADPITPGAWQGSHWSANF